jgi:hypothetical protein
VTWDIRPVDGDETVEDLVSFFYGSASYTLHAKDRHLNACLGRLVGVERGGKANSQRLGYIDEIFAEAYELAPSLGLEVDPGAIRTFERLRGSLELA